MQPASRDHRALIAAARHGLPDELAGRLPVVMLADAEAEDVRMFCRTDRLSGLFASAVAVGEIVMSGEQAELSADDWHHGLRACVQVEALLVRVAERLDALAVRWAVTKGSSVAHLDYHDPAQRLFADVDLVVHCEDWERVLHSLSGRQGVGPHTSAFTRRYGKGETLVVDDMEIDLHLRFAVGRFGVLSRMEDCFVELDSFSLAGRRVPAMTPEFRLLHACVHAVLGGNPGLRASRDVAQLIATHPDRVDATWRLAARWNASAVMATAILAAWRSLQLLPDHAVVARASEVTIRRADRAALAVFASHAGFRRQALTAISALPVGERPSFLLAAGRMSREARR